MGDPFGAGGGGGLHMALMGLCQTVESSCGGIGVGQEVFSGHSRGMRKTKSGSRTLSRKYGV